MPLRRRNRLVAPPTANVIVVEGSKREFRYFEQAAKAAVGHGTWSVTPAGGGDPISLLRKTREELTNADRVFVVFDTDRMPPACTEAEARHWSVLVRFAERKPSSVRLIRSHPCIEIRFLMHLIEAIPPPDPVAGGSYPDQSSRYKQLLRNHMPELDARPINDWAKLAISRPEACRLARKARTAATPPAVWSDVDLLMRELGLD